MTRSPVSTTASARVVGMPSAAMASLTIYSRRTGPSACPAVAAARERGPPGSFQLKVASASVGRHDLADQDRPPVTKLGNETAELMAGVSHRDRLRLRRQFCTAEHRATPLVAGEALRIHPELSRQTRVERHEPRGCARCRPHCGTKRSPEPGKTIVEGQAEQDVNLFVYRPAPAACSIRVQRQAAAATMRASGSQPHCAISPLRVVGGNLSPCTAA